MLASEAAESMWVLGSSYVGMEHMCAHAHISMAKRANMDQCHLMKLSVLWLLFMACSWWCRLEENL